MSNEDKNLKEKKKKPILKIILLILAIMVLFTMCMNSCLPDENDVDKPEASSIKEPDKQKEASEANTQEPDVPREYKSALNSAKSYASNMNMSKAGIYDQLTSEYGEKFTPEAAQYAIDNLEWDWKKNALETARDYQETMDMSPAAIYDQLISEHGEKFTPEEAQYAIDNLE